MKLSWQDTRKGIARWVAACSGLANDKVAWSRQGGKWPAAPWISLNLQSVRGVGSDWTRHEHNPLVIPDLVIDSIDDVVNTVSAPLHLRVHGDGPVRLTTTGVLPDGLALATDYWLIVDDANTLRFAASRSDAIAAIPVAIDLLDAGTGIHTIVDTPDTRRIGEEIIHVVEGMRRSVLSLQCFADDVLGDGAAEAILERVRVAHRLPDNLQRMRDIGFAVATIGETRYVGGSLSSASDFEPRAVQEIILNHYDSISAPGTTIERVELTAEIENALGDVVETFVLDVDID